MNIPSLQSPATRNYLSMDGQRKTLAAPSGAKVNENVKAVLLEQVSGSACVVCFELLEKTLQTRCCKTILCAQCYDGINVPKMCPQCRFPWREGISMALLVGDRHINEHIASALGHFQDVASTGKDIEKAKCQVDTLNLLRESSGETEARQTLSDCVFRRLGFRVSVGCLDELTRARAKVFQKENLSRFDSLFFELYEQFCINPDQMRVAKIVAIGEMIGFDLENMAHLNKIFRLLQAESSVRLPR